MATEKRILALKRKHSKKLLAHPSVVGVGVEREDDQYVLTVHLAGDAPELPQQIDGEGVRYIRTDRYTKQ